ncbi:unnamed protein product, partial [Pylaiella littoralis]
SSSSRSSRSKRQRLLDATTLLHDLLWDKGALDEELSGEEKAAFLDGTWWVLCGYPDHRFGAVATKHNQRTANQQTLKSTGIRRLRNQPVYPTPSPLQSPPPPRLISSSTSSSSTPPPSRRCYVCKAHFNSIHHFYDQLCPNNDKCAPSNFRKRTELADLSGKVALLTGGRIKIGYQAAIKLLRSGCARVIVTTRFPRDAAARYAAEPDFEDWAGRLEVFGLDMRHTPGVEAFTRFVLNRYHRLDFIVNNAAQTVRRPPRFYEHMLARETAPFGTLAPDVRKFLSAYEENLLLQLQRSDDSPPPPVVGLTGAIVRQPLLLHRDGASDKSGADGCRFAGLARPAELSQVPLLKEDRDLLLRSSTEPLFPVGQRDQDMQQVDLRGTNSWLLELHQVSTVELLETQLVNAVAPFVINARLKPLMEATPGVHKHIVNVSAMEGQFYRKNKTTRHPHTNMAKAALNMMTRTSAADYFPSGIH